MTHMFSVSSQALRLVTCVVIRFAYPCDKGPDMGACAWGTVAELSTHPQKSTLIRRLVYEASELVVIDMSPKAH